MKNKTSRRPTHGRATAKDVANLAGVSLTTVSRAYNTNVQISSRTHEKVRNAAAQLKYSPNMAARALAGRRSNLIGILVNNFDDPEQLELFRFVSAEAQKRGFHALLLNISQEGQQVESVDAAFQYQVDGLLVSASRLPESLVQRGAELHKPVVVVGQNTAQFIATMWAARGPSPITCLKRAVSVLLLLVVAPKRLWLKSAKQVSSGGLKNSTDFSRFREWQEQMNMKPASIRSRNYCRFRSFLTDSFAPVTWLRLRLAT